MIKLATLLLVLNLSQGVFARERTLSCVSTSHENYSADLFFDGSEEVEYNLEVKVDGSLKYNIFFNRTSELDLDLVSRHVFKLAQQVQTNISFFQREGYEFVLFEPTFFPRQLDEVQIIFLCAESL